MVGSSVSREWKGTRGCFGATEKPGFFSFTLRGLLENVDLKLRNHITNVGVAGKGRVI